MATVVLLRHARSTANGAGVLAGRGPGVELDERGRDQLRTLPGRLAALAPVALLTSPLRRCLDTVAPIAELLDLPPVVEARLAEVDYGRWTGHRIAELISEPLWEVVQRHPSAAVFPGGEGLAQVQARAVAAVREHDARINAAHGPDAIWLACTHGDVIKSVVADAMGTHLDAFQRIVVEPCSISVIRYTDTRPFVLRLNDTGGDPADLIRRPTGEVPRSDAAVGGASGV